MWTLREAILCTEHVSRFSSSFVASESIEFQIVPNLEFEISLYSIRNNNNNQWLWQNGLSIAHASGQHGLFNKRRKYPFQISIAFLFG